MSLRDAFGRLALPDYKVFVPVVAEAYLARPDYEESAVSSWIALQKHIDRLFQQMSRKINVIFTANDPYPDYVAMAEDIRVHRRMYIWTGESTHGVWTPEQNWRFRAVHDYMIHLAGSHSFELRGEMGAYNRHIKLAPPSARTALFTEIVGQTCTYWHTREFAPQKIAKLYGFDYVNVGLWDKAEYKRNWSEV